MNYIKHLTGFFDRVVPDDRLNPTHISLYMSLFQFWNVNRFQNPISISRDEVMRVSKICAKATYHKCMRDLHNFGYLQYVPSYNPFKGSLIYLVIFDPDYEPVQKTEHRHINKQSGTGTGMWTACEQALVPSINNINITNNKNIREEPPQNRYQNFIQDENAKLKNQKEGKRKKVPTKKEKEFFRPGIEETVAFFSEHKYPEIEARKFFNYFESNGWRVGGKSPMKDWKAAARNWFLNIPKFNHQPKPVDPVINLNQSKNYNEPL